MHVQNYADAKSEVIEEILKRALAPSESLVSQTEKLKDSQTSMNAPTVQGSS
jgi:hypothetical protein